MTDKVLREKIRLRGVEHIKEHFFLDQYGDEFLNMINHLTSY